MSFDPNDYLNMVLECGRINLSVMELPDKAHVGAFGNPVPAEVDTGTKNGPGILVTGHDLLDLYELLKQTDGMGVNVYTHGEMLPGHGYPGLKKFTHLADKIVGAVKSGRIRRIFLIGGCDGAKPGRNYYTEFS